MALQDAVGENIIQWTLNIAIAVVAFMWRITYGRLEKRMTCVEEKLERQASQFASKDDLAQLREDYNRMIQHIDNRFDNLTNLLQLIINGKK